MSHPRQNFNGPNLEIGTDILIPHCTVLTCTVHPSRCRPPKSAQNQALPGVSNFVDGSGHIFSMYSKMVTEEDKKMVEDRKADADGILIFVRLSSNDWVLYTHWLAHW